MPQLFPEKANAITHIVLVTVAVLLLSTIGFLNGRPDFLDLAIVYALLNVIGTIAVLKFFRYGSLGE